MKSAVDTNIIIRIIVGDDEKLLAKARNFVKKHSHGEIFVSIAVIVETYYVLLKYYSYSTEDIVEGLIDLMKIEQLNFEHETAVRLALSKIKSGFSFGDSLIGEIGSVKNIKTYTFDKSLKKNTSFVVLE